MEPVIHGFKPTKINNCLVTHAYAGRRLNLGVFVAIKNKDNQKLKK